MRAPAVPARRHDEEERPDGFHQPTPAIGHRRHVRDRQARQAGGWRGDGDLSARPRCSRTSTSSNPREGIDFFPLTMDVEERMYAAGKIPGSFFRREGRPSETAILTARLTDRPLRPSFAEGFRDEVHVVITVLSVGHGQAVRHPVDQRRVARHDASPGSRSRGPSERPRRQSSAGSGRSTRPTRSSTSRRSTWSWPAAATTRARSTC